MSHTYTNLITHFIFSTKDRAPEIQTDLHERLLPYMGGIIGELKGVPLAINAMPDHVHLLISLAADVAPAEMMRVVKTNSSRWVHEHFPEYKAFAWQKGYAAFSVSESGADK